MPAYAAGQTVGTTYANTCETVDLFTDNNVLFHAECRALNFTKFRHCILVMRARRESVRHVQTYKFKQLCLFVLHRGIVWSVHDVLSQLLYAVCFCIKLRHASAAGEWHGDGNGMAAAKNMKIEIRQLLGV